MSLHQLGSFLPAWYQIAGFHLRVQKEQGALPVFCPCVMDTFASRQKEDMHPLAAASVSSADFTLTIGAVCPIQHIDPAKQLQVTQQEVILQYGTDQEYVYVRADRNLHRWNLYTAAGGSQMDAWFDRIGNLFAWAMPGQGALVLHGVILEWKGKGILLTAPSGTGKTTHARLWRDCENALIINGDRALIRREGSRWYAYGMPWSGSSGECINRKVPLCAIVCLKQWHANKAEQLEPVRAIEFVLPRLIAPKWHPVYAAAAVDLALHCLEEVPCFALLCRPDADAVCVLKHVLDSCVT